MLQIKSKPPKIATTAIFFTCKLSYKRFLFFFLNYPAPPEIYPLPLPAPLPINAPEQRTGVLDPPAGPLHDAHEGVRVEVGHVRVDDLPPGGGQVVDRVRYLQVAVDPPGAGPPPQVHQELVRVVDVLEPVPRRDEVVRR